MMPTCVLRQIKFQIAVAASLLLFGTMAFGASIDAYRTRIESASKMAFDLERTLTNAEVDHAKSRQLVDQIRREFPQSERIEWAGGSVEVSNDWLLQQALELEKTSEIKTSLPIVAAIREHLASVSHKLNELEEGKEETRSKDEDKQKLGDILRREEYQKPKEAEESAVQRWLRNFLEWFMDLWPTPSTSGQSLTGMEGFISVLRILLYLVLFGLICFLIYKVVPLLIPRLRRTAKPKKKSRVILGEQIDEDQVASDLFNEAERLAREGDLRSAIRKGYMALLCDLNDRRIIGLARNKTNRDYLRDVRARRDLHKRMQSVTDMFERHWYGFQESQPTDWARFTEEYREAIKSS